MNLQRERLLIERAKVDSAAFGELFDEYYPAIFSYVLKRAADPVVAQDIASETFLKALQNLYKFQWRDVSISSWFYKIATNELRMYFRAGKYTPSSLEQLYDQEGYEPEGDTDIVTELVDIQSAIDRSQAFLQAQSALVKLPLKYQEVISLRFVEKKKLSEIGQILGKKEGTIKSLLSRGLKKLRQELESATVQPFEQLGIIASEGLSINKPQESYEK
jgi:RNA polymerase sigma-70 factor (ECF subfamily)